MQKLSRYIESYEHKFSEMREHMFYGETLERLSRYIPETNDIKKKIKKGVRQGVRVAGLEPPKVEKRTSFICAQRDRLFWSFFVVFKGTSAFFALGQHTFSEEKKFKFDSVALMRQKAAQLKAANVSLNQAENEMVNAHEITLVGLEALCLVYEISILYIVGKSYYDFRYGDKYHVIERVDRGCAVIQDDVDAKISNARDTLFLMNTRKPIKSISSYVIGELQTLAKRLGIHTVTEAGKPLTKKILYEALVLMTGKLQQMV
jgi:hypothetical protein